MREVRNAIEGTEGANAAVLANRWWVVLIRGLAAVAFGLISLFVPSISLFALVAMFGAYALIDGVFNLVMAVRDERRGRRWGALVFEGIVSMVAGILAFVWPGITALVLVLVVAAWAFVTGVAEIFAAIRLRKQINHEWLLALSGVLSVAFGVAMALFPRAGALALVVWIGAYAVVFGGLMIGLAFKLRKWHEPSELHTGHGDIAHNPAR